MHTLNAFRYLVEELTASSRRVLEYSRNRDATGLHRERLVQSYIRRIAPHSFGIGNGFIHGSTESSKQIDIIVYDRDNYSPLFDEGGYIVTIPSSVVHAVEVKSYLDETQLRLAFANLSTATNLNPNIHTSIFAFDGLSVETIFKHLTPLIAETSPTMESCASLPRSIVCLNNWIIIYGRSDSSIVYKHFYEKSFEEQFTYYFADLYFRMYGYRRKLHPDDKLPLLEEQGFDTSWRTGKHSTLTISPTTKSNS